MKRIIPAVLLVFLCGCFKTKDELAINADGSGKVRIETRSSLPPDVSQGGMGSAMSFMGGGAIAIYPPTTEDAAQKLFPAKDFSVTTKQEKADNGDTITTIEATFKDINALLNSPYGRAHALTVTIDKGVLTVKGVSGMEAAARFAELKDETGMGMQEIPGLADMQKKKDEMRSEFRITLPNALTAANGTRDGKSAAWVVDRAKIKDAADFARQLGAVSEVSCLADGLKFSPVTPVRLGLLPFKDLAAGPTGNKGAAPETNRISAAAKFVPYGLVVTRSLDLSGEGGGEENSAQLIGAVTLPRELAPQKWGEPKLDEALDAKGNSLKLAGNEERMSSFRYRSLDLIGDEEEEDSKPAAEERHVVTFGFKPPDWKVKEIARIKGSVGLQYFGGSREVVKLTNAIPANWIADVSRMMSGGFDSTEKKINDTRLAESGLTLTLQMGMTQSGMTMLSLQTAGTQAVLADAQVFDADGAPWPTFLTQENALGDEGSCQVMVAGKPKPPLSLALVVSGGGATIDVPILVEHVPVAGK